MRPPIVLGILPHYVLQATDCCRHCTCLQEAGKTFAFHSYVLRIDYIFAYGNTFFNKKIRGESQSSEVCWSSSLLKSHAYLL